MKSSLSSLAPLVRLSAELGFPIVFHKILGELWDENPFLFPELLSDMPWEQAFDKAIATAEALAQTEVLPVLRGYKRALADCVAGVLAPRERDPSILEDLREALAQLPGDRPIYLMGVSAHLYANLYGVDLAALGLHGILETDQDKFGKTILGLPVRSFDEMADIAEATLVCMYTRHRKLVYTLAERHGRLPRLVDRSLARATRRRVDVLARQLSGAPVVVHGAGGHTVSLLSRQGTDHLNVVAISDRDRALHGTRLLDLPIIAPEDIPRYASTVVISSETHEVAMFRELREMHGDALALHALYYDHNANAHA